MKSQDCEIILDIMIDSTAVPNILLEYYKEYKLSEKETLFLISLLRLQGEKIELSIHRILEKTPYTKGEMNKLIPNLVDQGFLCLNAKEEVLTLHCLFDKLREGWGWREAKAMRLEKEKENNEQVDKGFSLLYNVFQEEMGRPLSPMEGEQIKDWFYTMSLPAELITEALKRAVLIDKRNFQYINKILLSWHGKGVHSLKELTKIEGKKEAAPKEKKTKKKYREDQDVDIFEDIFEVN